MEAVEQPAVQQGLLRRSPALLKTQLASVYLIHEYASGLESGFVVETPGKLRAYRPTVPGLSGGRHNRGPTLQCTMGSSAVRAEGDVGPLFFHPAVAEALKN
jgi:hypothetical protein